MPSPGDLQRASAAGIEGTMRVIRIGVRSRRASAIASALGLFLALTTVSRAAPGLDADAWDGFLDRYTRETSDVAGVRVDYAGLAGDPSWRAFVSGLEHASPPREPAGRLAFWIDVYNVLAIDMVVRHRPVASIRDVGSWLRPVWKHPAGKVAGRTVTLDEVEHRILRPIGEPRIHAAIVCASTSCPSLRREAYQAERLEAQLDAAMRDWLASPAKGVRIEADRVLLSRIFDWFAADFEPAGGALAFARPYLSESARVALDALGPNPRIEWLEYDWTLNDSAGAPR
jgi:hypothetical protein